MVAEAVLIAEVDRCRSWAAGRVDSRDIVVQEAELVCCIRTAWALTHPNADKETLLLLLLSVRGNMEAVRKKKNKDFEKGAMRQT